MRNKKLIEMLLRYPQDMEVAFGLPNNEENTTVDCYAINSVELIKIYDEDLIVLHWEETTDPNLN